MSDLSPSDSFLPLGFLNTYILYNLVKLPLPAKGAKGLLIGRYSFMFDKGGSVIVVYIWVISLCYA